MKKNYIPIFETFLVEPMMQLDLSLQDFICLRWFHGFVNTNKMKRIFDEEEKEYYYWVQYKTTVEDQPLLKNERCVSDYFGHLCGLWDSKTKNKLKYPLKRKIVKTQNGTIVYFRPIPEIMSMLIPGSHNQEYIEKEYPNPKTGQYEEKVSEEQGINSEVWLILNAVFNKSGHPFEGSHKLAPNNLPQSKTIIKIEKILYAFKDGTYLKEHPLDEKWTKGIDLSILDNLNSWKDITHAIEHASEIYFKWKKESNRPELLTDKFVDWLYNPRTKKSLFLSCLSKPHSERGFAAEKIKESIEEKTRLVIEKIYDKSWSQFAFWKSMKEVYLYLKENWFAIQQFNIKYMGEEDKIYNRLTISKVFEAYRIFINNMKYDADPNYLGLTYNIWKKFTNVFYEDTNIDLDPGKEDLEKYKRSK